MKSGIGQPNRQELIAVHELFGALHSPMIKNVKSDAYQYQTITATIFKVEAPSNDAQNYWVEYNGLNTDTDLKFEPAELKKKENTGDGLWYYFLCSKIR